MLTCDLFVVANFIVFIARQHAKRDLGVVFLCVSPSRIVLETVGLIKPPTYRQTFQTKW